MCAGLALPHHPPALHFAILFVLPLQVGFVRLGRRGEYPGRDDVLPQDPEGLEGSQQEQQEEVV